MANDFSGVPLKLDSTMPSTFRNTVISWTYASIYPTRIYWENPVNSGDTFVIANPAGGTLFTGRCESSDQSQWFNIPSGVKWYDWQLNTIASGTLYIYFVT